jgi:hypothetical protein
LAAEWDVAEDEAAVGEGAGVEELLVEAGGVEWVLLAPRTIGAREAVIVEEVLLDERGAEVGAAEDEHVLLPAGFEMANFGCDVEFDQLGFVPIGARQDA